MSEMDVRYAERDGDCLADAVFGSGKRVTLERRAQWKQGPPYTRIVAIGDSTPSFADELHARLAACLA